MNAPDHLIIAPILIPFFAGALMLLYPEGQRRAKLVMGLGSTILLLLTAMLLISRSSGSSTASVDVYLLGDWPVPIAIVLVLDRLSALMLMLTALLALPALVYSAAGWHRQGQHFHSLFQFFLMGVNGAFLTGDLFNLFVFFEVLLAASYGLLLHGSGRQRVQAGLHFIAINLAASLLFLISASLIYGLTGTLNMADLAGRVANLSGEQLALFDVAAVFLALVFLVKAAIWPLSFWLPGAYVSASAPVAAMFAIATKVGIYAILRLSMLLVGPETGGPSGIGAEILIVAGFATVIFGTIGVLASQELGRIAAHLVLVSSGTVLAAVGFALGGWGGTVLAGALYYTVSSTLAAGALFLLAEPMSRGTGGAASLMALTEEAYGPQEEDEAEPEFGLRIPGSTTSLGLAFGACVLLLAGMPPLSGFLGKFVMLNGLLVRSGEVPVLAWWFLGILLVSGFSALIALVRLGVQTIWTASDEPAPVLVLEVAPTLVLIAMAVLLTVRADAAMGYARDTALSLMHPAVYVDGVARTPRVHDEVER